MRVATFVPTRATNNQPTPRTKIPAAPVDATCFCAVYFACRFVSGAGHRCCNRCNCVTGGRRDSRLVPHCDRCRSANGCYMRFSSTICVCTQFQIVCFLPVLGAAGCNLPNLSLPRIRVDVLRFEAVPVHCRASARWTKQSFTAQPSSNPCSLVHTIVFPIRFPLPLPF